MATVIAAVLIAVVFRVVGGHGTQATSGISAIVPSPHAHDREIDELERPLEARTAASDPTARATGSAAQLTQPPAASADESFKLKYRTLSRAARQAAMSALQADLDLSVESAFSRRLQDHQYAEYVQNGAGFVRDDPHIPQGSFVRTIQNPEDSPQVEGQTTIRQMYLSPEEYPDLFETRTEIDWLYRHLDG